MAVQVNSVTDKGGSVELNDSHRVWCSYAVTTAGDLPPPELLYASASFNDELGVQFFFNRESGLIVVDVVSEKVNCGNEILRRNIQDVEMPTDDELAAMGEEEADDE